MPGTASTTDELSTTDAEDAGFIPLLDVLSEACDPWGPDTCPSGFKCAPYGHDGVTRCSPLPADPVGVYESCDTILVPAGDECVSGALCAKWWGEPMCMPMCSGSVLEPECSDPCEGCLRFGSWDAGAWGICLKPCDPLSPRCEPAEKCSGEPGFMRPSCNPTSEERASMEQCFVGTMCAEGLTCVDAANVPGCAFERCCTDVCDLDDPDACAGAEPGVVCVPWFEDPMLAAQCAPTLGVCRTP
jgi:hypothetical protein